MTPSEEILQSIEHRLLRLDEEIAALKAARARLSADVEPESRAPQRTVRKRPVRRRQRRAATAESSRGSAVRAAGAGPSAPKASELTEEEWVAHRAAELTAQSRQVAAA